MTKTDQNKLRKALQMMEKAKEIVDGLEGKYDNFKYDCNAVFRTNRVKAAVSILERAVEEFCETEA